MYLTEFSLPIIPLKKIFKKNLIFCNPFTEFLVLYVCPLF